jgi:hypothetical protein
VVERIAEAVSTFSFAASVYAAVRVCPQATLRLAAGIPAHLRAI